MMRAVHAVLAVAFLVLRVFVASSAWAGTVSGLNVFQANTTARASEVNDNFSAVADAVNDNAATISDKQARVTGVCPAEQSIRAIAQDGAVTCEPDDVGGDGDITAVRAGFGLSDGGDAGDVSLSVDTAAIQRRVNGVCTAGQSIRSIAEDGTVSCESDDTGISELIAGVGLRGGGTEPQVTLSADTTVLQARISDVCPEGQAINAVNGDGTVVCEELSVADGHSLDAADGSQIDVVFVANDGNVGVGTATPSAKLEVVGEVLAEAFGGTSVITTVTVPNDLEIIMEPVDDPTIFSFFDVFKGGGAPIFSLSEVGNLNVSGTVQAQGFVSISDVRLKKDIGQLANALDKLSQIRGVYFSWNQSREMSGEVANDREIGVIAQEIEAVFPELIRVRSDNGLKAVDYGGLTAVLVEAVKGLKAENDLQQQKLSALEERLRSVEGGFVRGTLHASSHSFSDLGGGWIPLLGFLLLGVVLSKRIYERE